MIAKSTLTKIGKHTLQDSLLIWLRSWLIYRLYFFIEILKKNVYPMQYQNKALKLISASLVNL